MGSSESSFCGFADLQSSLVDEASISNSQVRSSNQNMPNAVGWELNNRGLKASRCISLAQTMDPTRLAIAAADLNLKLMRWRALPSLNLDLLSSTRCLLLGTGTLARGPCSEQPLGILLHQIRGPLSQFSQMTLVAHASTSCTACSFAVVSEYQKRELEFILEAINHPTYIEDITGLIKLMKSASSFDLDWDEDETGDDEDEEFLEIVTYRIILNNIYL